MTFLLDVNALVALGFLQHEFHARTVGWLRAARLPQLATCSITELGFVRVLSQAAAYGFTVVQARAALLHFKKGSARPLVFITDAHDVSHLPAWVKYPKQITDGHLAALAKANGAVLATLDEKIPGAFLIP